jgi:uncharacterized membrane protein
MEKKKLLNGSLDKNIVMGLSWLVPLFALIAFIIDFKTLDVEEKRQFVSIFACLVISWVLVITIVGPFVVLVFEIIAMIKAFMGQDFKVPGAYHIAAAIIK